MDTPGVPVSHGVELPEQTRADVIRRLRRVEGQVRGLQQMLTEGRGCREIVTQLSAANKALEQAGFVGADARRQRRPFSQGLRVVARPAYRVSPLQRWPAVTTA